MATRTRDESSLARTASHRRRAALAALVAANVALAFGPWLVRRADVGPIASGFWRQAIALPMLLAVTRATGQRLPRLSPAIWLAVLLAGLFFAGDLSVWHTGILRTRLANATLFANVASFMLPAYGYLVARRWPARSESAALLLAVLGMGLLLGRSYQLSSHYLVGDLLCVCAGLFYTLYFIALDRARAAVAPLPMLAIATAAGLAPLLAFAMLAGERIWPGDWTPLVLLALGSQLFGQGLLVFALGELPPLVVGMGLLIQPVVAALVGRAVYGERLGAADLIGAAAVGAALVLVRRRR